LGGKYFLESVFGVKYPQIMAPTKRVSTVGWDGVELEKLISIVQEPCSTVSLDFL
jgi:hypothetical protein